MLMRIHNQVKGCVDCVMEIAQNHVILAMIIVYIFVLVLFATINWIIFFNNTTAYLISDQLNKYVEKYEFLNLDIDLATYHRNAKDCMPITISDFTEMIRVDLEKLQSANDSLSVKKDAYEKCVVRWDSLSRIASGMRADSVKMMHERLLGGCQSKMDSLKQLIVGKDRTEMILEGKYVELAQLRYEYAKKNAEVESYMTKYIGFFIPDSLSHQIRRCNEDYLELSMEIYDMESLRRNATYRIRQAAIDFHRNRLKSVNWVDFLYYSICVSTTVSFGDIAPNNGTTRFVAILELLLCLFIVGFIVDRIIKKGYL